ncbi:MAG: Hsp20/alpha crystallin family protein [Eubacteriales bacterium]|nr:Hsp20/alpha crystallin family protein [Eubacteriales bacterium]
MYGIVPFRWRNTEPGRRNERGLSGILEDFWDKDGLFPAIFPETGTMRADIRENENEYVVEAELPGVKKEDIKLDIDDDTLTICAESKMEKKEEKDSYLRMERRYGSFSRTFSIENIKNEDVKAEYNDGILKVILPKNKKTATKKRTVEIK